MENHEARRLWIAIADCVKEAKEFGEFSSYEGAKSADVDEAEKRFLGIERQLLWVFKDITKFAPQMMPSGDWEVTGRGEA